MRRGRPGCCLGRVRPVSRDEMLLRFQVEPFIGLNSTAVLTVLIAYVKGFHGLESDVAPCTQAASSRNARKCMSRRYPLCRKWLAP